MTTTELKQKIIHEIGSGIEPEKAELIADRIIDNFCEYLDSNKTGVVMSVVIVPEIIEKLQSQKNERYIIYDSIFL